MIRERGRIDVKSFIGLKREKDEVVQRTGKYEIWMDNVFLLVISLEGWNCESVLWKSNRDRIYFEEYWREVPRGVNPSSLGEDAALVVVSSNTNKLREAVKGENVY